MRNGIAIVTESKDLWCDFIPQYKWINGQICLHVQRVNLSSKFSCVVLLVSPPAQCISSLQPSASCAPIPVFWVCSFRSRTLSLFYECIPTSPAHNPLRPARLFIYCILPHSTLPLLPRSYRVWSESERKCAFDKGHPFFRHLFPV